MDFEDRKWDIVIDAGKKSFSVGIRQLCEYKDLIIMFVKRDIATSYKQTVLGPLWYLVQPVCTTIMCMIVFQNVASLGTDGIPPVLFYLAGTILWAFFSNLLTAEARVFSDNKEIFGKVYFPRLTVPISILLGELLKFLIQLALFALAIVLYYIKGYHGFVSIKLLLLPIVIMWIAIQACGFGLVISSITTKYRDLAKALLFFLSLFMYATPVVYPLSEVAEKYRIYFGLNPVTAVMECFRMSCFGAGLVRKEYIIYSVLCTLVFLLMGLALYSKNEKTFVDVI